MNSSGSTYSTIPKTESFFGGWCQISSYQIAHPRSTMKVDVLLYSLDKDCDVPISQTLPISIRFTPWESMEQRQKRKTKRFIADGVENACMCEKCTPHYQSLVEKLTKNEYTARIAEAMMNRLFFIMEMTSVNGGEVFDNETNITILKNYLRIVFESERNASGNMNPLSNACVQWFGSYHIIDFGKLCADEAFTKMFMNWWVNAMRECIKTQRKRFVQQLRVLKTTNNSAVILCLRRMDIPEDIWDEAKFTTIEKALLFDNTKSMETYMKSMETYMETLRHYRGYCIVVANILKHAFWFNSKNIVKYLFETQGTILKLMLSSRPEYLDVFDYRCTNKKIFKLYLKFIQKQFETSIFDHLYFPVPEEWNDCIIKLFRHEQCKTHDRCMIMMHEPEKYITCTSNVPHVTCVDCFMKLQNKTECPYCRMSFSHTIFCNE